jgi:hypothetical protein
MEQAVSKTNKKLTFDGDPIARRAAKKNRKPVCFPVQDECLVRLACQTVGDRAVAPGLTLDEWSVTEQGFSF